jgi:hypothetical protein
MLSKAVLCRDPLLDVRKFRISIQKDKRKRLDPHCQPNEVQSITILTKEAFILPRQDPGVLRPSKSAVILRKKASPALHSRLSILIIACKDIQFV